MRMTKQLKNCLMLAIGAILGVLLVPSVVTTASAHGGDTNKIHSCVANIRIGNQVLRVLRLVGANESCRSTETALDWNVQGPASPTQSGQILGSVNNCGPSNAGIIVHIPGRSFQAYVLPKPAGSFTLDYVPAGTYTLQIEIPGRPAETVPNVVVAANTITNVPPITICRDSDGDGFKEDVDCNDNNAAVHPGAAEICNGKDDNCNGQVDEGCSTCTDGDQDSFFAQAGCATPVDCNDTDATIHPNALEICDSRDNNCNGVNDEGFNFSSDTANCGGCGVVCSFPNATPACVNGGCMPMSCNPGFGDCDGIAANGCETSTQTSAANCGGCNLTCGQGFTCQNGACQ